MQFNKSFFKLAAVCALLSGLTTLGVHLLPRLYAGPADFERVVSLHANPVYLFRLWIVVLHILLVVASVWGIAARKLKDDAGLMILRFLGYLLFAAAELFRAALGLCTLLNEYGGIKGLVIPEWHAWTYQPAVRFLIAAWLWQTPTQPSQ